MYGCWRTITTEKLEESVKFYEEVVGLSAARYFFACSGHRDYVWVDGPAVYFVCQIVIAFCRIL